MSRKSLLSYYQDYHFNPVPIPLEDEASWKAHFAKRHNLYQRHLGIPISFFSDRSVLEFGCNSGENSLVLASAGANLTLVEPNDQVLPRLKALFKKFDLEARITELVKKDIARFESEKCYDAVLAEGFLNTLPNRDEMFRKIARLLVPGGVSVISFDDRYGCLLEITKRMILLRACQLKSIDDINSEASLEIAKEFYEEDFLKLKASRPFQVWWKDTLINPFFTWDDLWTYPEIVSLIEKAGCEFYSSSPRWSSIDYYEWYKDVSSTRERHERLLDNWLRSFPYFLTGSPGSSQQDQAVPKSVIDAVDNLIRQLSDYTQKYSNEFVSLTYPTALDKYLAAISEPLMTEFNDDLKMIYAAVRVGGFNELLHVYKSAKRIRNFWGTPYHYVCFTKLI
ncbi:MAG: class I SAM-dependent methyltransferase [Candidatus Aminicenantaceae bacterium]